MATLARGVSKKVAIKKETAGQWGVLPGASGAKYLPRVTAAFNVEAETFQSETIRTDFQIEDFRQGTRSAKGSVNTEISPGVYSDFFAAALAKDFAAGGTTASASVTIATSGDFYTVTRAAGSWLTDGFYVGNVIRLTGAGLNVANVDVNLVIASMTATVLTVMVINGYTLFAEGPIAAVSVAVVGKQSYTPQTGHTDDSFTVEEFYSDVSVSEVYTGLKVGSVSISLPTSGFATADFSMEGRGLSQTGTTQYFSSPTTPATTGITTALTGAVLVNGTPAGVITSADITIDRGLEAAKVIGTNFAAGIFTGRVNVSGNFSTYFQDATYRDYFLNETDISLVLVLASGSEKDANVVSFVMPRVAVGSSTRNDTESGLVQEHSFQALLNTDAADGLPVTTLLVQDSAVV